MALSRLFASQQNSKGRPLLRSPLGHCQTRCANIRARAGQKQIWRWLTSSREKGARKTKTKSVLQLLRSGLIVKTWGRHQKWRQNYTKMISKIKTKSDPKSGTPQNMKINFKRGFEMDPRNQLKTDPATNSHSRKYANKHQEKRWHFTVQG